MPFSGWDQQKTYYYAICVITFFVLMWGVIDLGSTVMALTANPIPAPVGMGATPVSEGIAPAQDKSPEADFEQFYQDKVLYDRLFDSIARILVSGVIFFYCRYKINLLENKA